MESIKGFKIKKLDFELIKRGDLISFGSPLLSHFYDENGSNYLMSWIDCNDKYNRWLLFNIEQFDLFQYFSKEKSLKDLIKNTSEIIYFLDFDNDINIKSLTVTSKKLIPKGYLPEEDSYFEDEIATKYALNLKNEILNVYKNYNLRNIKSKIRNYKKHKDDPIFIDILDKRNIRNTINEVLTLKASELPLQILDDYYKEFNSFNHLIHKARLAYDNPFELDSYFIELDNILKTKVYSTQVTIHQNSNTNKRVIKNAISSPGLIIKSNINPRNVFGQLVKCTDIIVSKEPQKYGVKYAIWKEDIEKTEISNLLKEYHEK